MDGSTEGYIVNDGKIVGNSFGTLVGSDDGSVEGSRDIDGSVENG